MIRVLKFYIQIVLKMCILIVFFVVNILDRKNSVSLNDHPLSGSIFIPKVLVESRRVDFISSCINN